MSVCSVPDSVFRASHSVVSKVAEVLVFLLCIASEETDKHTLCTGIVKRTRRGRGVLTRIYHLAIELEVLSGEHFISRGHNFRLLVVSLHLSEGPFISKGNTPTRDLISVTLGSAPEELQGQEESLERQPRLQGRPRSLPVSWSHLGFCSWCPLTW